MEESGNGTKKSSCWEVEKCGREPNGNKVVELGPCPAALDQEKDGINSGNNGGRICWTVAGTLCRGEIQGTMANKEVSCLNCSFFKTVKSEEQDNFQLFPGMKV